MGTNDFTWSPRLAEPPWSRSGVSYSWSYLDNNWLGSQTCTGVFTTSVTRDARGFPTDISNNRTDMGSTTTYSLLGGDRSGLGCETHSEAR